MSKWIFCLFIFFNFISSAFADCDCSILTTNTMNCEQFIQELKVDNKDISNTEQDNLQYSFHICDCNHIDIITDFFISTYQLEKNAFYAQDKYPLILNLYQRIERPPIHFNI